MTIKFTDAAFWFRNEEQQIDAFNYLQSQTSSEVVAEFERRYRNNPVPICGVELIKQFEGCKLNAYRDPLTGDLPITIGWGSTRRKDGSVFLLGTKITQEEADELLDYDLKNNFLPSLRKIAYWSEMSQEMRGALLSFAYNLGANFYGSHGFSTITAYLIQKRWAEVPSALMLYVNPGTNVTEGLKRRRKAESDLWLRGLK